MRVFSLLSGLAGASVAVATPFLNQIDNSTWVFGNDLFNVTQGSVYATEIYYKGYELVGSAVGHYMGYGKHETDSQRWSPADAS
jgi:rhamnogalacturonan endolyase